MAEKVPVGRRIDFADTQGGPGVTVFSTDGKDRTAADFAVAMAQYEQTGKLPEGITYFEKGSLGEKFRSGFESVRAPVQSALEVAGGAVGERLATAVPGTGLALGIAQKLGLAPGNVMQQATQTGRQVGQAAGQFAGESINTPESAGATLGSMIATAGASGALAPLGARTLGIAGQMVRAGLGAGAGYYGGQLTRGDVDPSQALLQAAMAAAGQGAFGAAKSALVGSVSKKAEENVSKQLMAMMKENLADIGTDPGALRAITSDPKKFNQLIQRGMQGFREDMADVADNVVNAVNLRSPNTLSRTGANDLRKLANQFYEVGNQMLDNAGDVKALAIGKRQLYDIHGEMMKTVLQEYPNMSAKGRNQVFGDLLQAVDSVNKQVTMMMPGAEVFGALKRSGGDKGFSTEAFQKEVQSYFAQNPGSAMEQAGKIAFRGSPGTATDKPTIRTLRIPFTKDIPVLGAIKADVPMGKSYVGRVQSGVPETIAAGAMESAIQSFVRERD